MTLTRNQSQQHCDQTNQGDRPRSPGRRGRPRRLHPRQPVSARQTPPLECSVRHQADASTLYYYRYDNGRDHHIPGIWSPIRYGRTKRDQKRRPKSKKKKLKKTNKHNYKSRRSCGTSRGAFGCVVHVRTRSYSVYVPTQSALTSFALTVRSPTWYWHWSSSGGGGGGGGGNSSAPRLCAPLRPDDIGERQVPEGKRRRRRWQTETRKNEIGGPSTRVVTSLYVSSSIYS